MGRQKEEKNIAVYLPHIYAEYVSELRKSIEAEAKEKGYHLIFYTCFGDNSSIDVQEATNMRYDEGERSIFRLINLDNIDGMLILYDAFARTQYDEIYDMIRNRCHCPVVNFRTPMPEVEGVYNLYVDDSQAFADMVQHFIDVHKCTRIDLVTGPKDNPHSEYRLNIFKDVIGKNNLPFEEDCIHWGNFWKNCGEGIVEEMMASERGLPEAIVCANDWMAISVIDALQVRGIQVPGQVLVSGYDDVVESRFNNPSITSIRQPMQEMGRKAIEILERLWNGEEVEQDTYLQEELVLRQSCGCEQVTEDYIRTYASMVNTNLDTVLYLETAASTMVTMLANATDMDECVTCLKKYALRETGFKSFALCLADHWEQQLPIPDVGYGSSERIITMVMGLFKGRVLEKERFPIKQLLPEVFAQDDEPVYIIPLHYLQHYMGYAIIQIDVDLVSNINIKSWFIHLDSALENFRMKQRLHQVANELESLYVRDTLTGLYNRRGLEKFGDKMYRECLEKQTQFMIMEIDMDGLKQVNDQYGHEEGDICITMIANGMVYAAKEDEICIRSGGDEYIVIGKHYTQEKLELFLERFDDFIDNANETLNKPYKFGASTGFFIGVPDGVHTVENYLKIADDRMYANKKERKAKSHPGIGVR